VHPLPPLSLTGALVTIEPLAMAHAESLLAAADDEEVFAWLPYRRPCDLAEAQAWIDAALTERDAHRRFPFVVLDASEGVVIGSTSYWDYNAERLSIEIGSTWLSRSRWHSGCNVETKLLLMSHAFETLGCERVAFRTDVLNARSRAAIERLGAVREGVHRHELRRRDGSWRDSVHYSILREEWPAVRVGLETRLETRGTHHELWCGPHQ
jgi:RimJ/RimL family protein N-acetyltransferase